MTKFPTLSLLASAALLLMALTQATDAREPKCDPDRWKADIAAFGEQDKADPPPPGGIVFVGSSSIRMWDLPRSFPDMSVINRGFGGSELCDSVHYFDTIVARYRPRVVVLYAGDNDVANGKSAEQIREDFHTFAKLMQEKLPKSSLIVVSIKPSPSRWSLANEMQAANREISAECERDAERLHFVDVWPEMLGEDGKPRGELYLEDQLHMSDEGYAIWASLLMDQLQPHEKVTP